MAFDQHVFEKIQNEAAYKKYLKQVTAKEWNGYINTLMKQMVAGLHKGLGADAIVKKSDIDLFMKSYINGRKDATGTVREGLRDKLKEFQFRLHPVSASGHVQDKRKYLIDASRTMGEKARHFAGGTKIDLEALRKGHLFVASRGVRAQSRARAARANATGTARDTAMPLDEFVLVPFFPYCT
jgi:hypothetical protein